MGLIILSVWEVFNENAIINPRFDSKAYLENDELWFVVGTAVVLVNGADYLISEIENIKYLYSCIISIICE